MPAILVTRARQSRAILCEDCIHTLALAGEQESVEGGGHSPSERWWENKCLDSMHTPGL